MFEFALGCITGLLILITILLTLILKGVNGR